MPVTPERPGFDALAKLWRIADSMRGRGENFDGINFVHHAKEAGIVFGVPELVYIMQRTGGRGDEYFVPTEVAEFIGKLLQPASPKVMLDPWAGFGLLAVPLNQLLHPERYDAYSPIAAACEILPQFEGASGINLRCIDPLRALTQSAERYDAIVGNTPFGMRSQEPLILQVGGENRKVRDD